jgi:hypothetical protein
MEYYKEAKTLVVTLTGSTQTIDLSSAVYNHKAVIVVPGNNGSTITVGFRFYSKGAVSSFIASTGATVDTLNIGIPTPLSTSSAISDYILPVRISSINVSGGISGQNILVVLLN